MIWPADDVDDATDEAIARHQQRLIDWMAQQGLVSRAELRDTAEDAPAATPDDKA